MNAPQHCSFRGRRVAVRVALVLATGGLLWRAVDLQLTHEAFLKHEGEARYLRVVETPAHRGKILDRHGEPLAISTPVDSVWANPGELAAAPQRWGELTRLLGLDSGELARLVEARRDREFVYLRRHVKPDLAAAVERAAVPGVYLQREYRRYYPFGQVTAHVVGFTNVDDVGQEGIELAYDHRLRGVPGAKRVVRDRLGRVVEDVESIRRPKAGRDLVLSVDRRVQFLAYRALAGAVRRHRARGGSVVLLDARTGEVLAMVNQPAYNPNNGADRVSRRFRNRAVTDLFEPGSSIKPFTIAAALESGRFEPGTRIDTSPGWYTLGKYTVRDMRDYGRIDLGTIVEKSSNVGASRVALALEPRELWQVLTRVGLGTPTRSRFPGESDGVLTHYFEWGDIHRATLSFGYGLSVTALQLAQAYAVLANDGRFTSVSLLRVDAPVEGLPVIRRDNAVAVRRMLESVLGPGGTATHARVGGYRVGGKTGTVRVSTPGGYAEDRYKAIFAGMAPMSRPRLVGVVVIDEPGGEKYYGGEVAAPVFAEVMGGALRLLGMPPDDESVPRRRVSAAGRGGARERASLAYAPNVSTAAVSRATP